MNKPFIILIIGNFGSNGNRFNGQSVKTREVYELIKMNLPKDNYRVLKIDTSNYPLTVSSIIKLIKVTMQASRIVYLPGLRNLQFLFPILAISSFFNFSKFVLLAVGGQLGNYLSSHSLSKLMISRFRYIGVESAQLKNQIEQLGLQNLSIFPNFRIYDFKPKANPMQDVLRVVFMARITPDKGCNILFNIAQKALCDGANIHFTFFGPIDSEYQDEFHERLEKTSNSKYGGLLNSNQVLEELNKFDVMVLPSFYQGEGYPGSIIEAYIAGIPAIVSNWKALPELVIEGQTGYVFDLRTPEDIYKHLLYLLHDPEQLKYLKNRSHKESYKYSANRAWQILEKYILISK